MIGHDDAAEIVALGEFVSELEGQLSELASREIAANALGYQSIDESSAALWKVRLDLRLARAALARAALARAALALVVPLRELTCEAKIDAARARVRSGDLVSMLGIDQS